MGRCEVGTRKRNLVEPCSSLCEKEARRRLPSFFFSPFGLRVALSLARL